MILSQGASAPSEGFSLSPLSTGRTMLTFNLILEHWQTQKLKFVTIEECIDLDDCISHVKRTDPDFDIIQITPAHA